MENEGNSMKEITSRVSLNTEWFIFVNKFEGYIIIQTLSYKRTFSRVLGCILVSWKSLEESVALHIERNGIILLS